MNVIMSPEPVDLTPKFDALKADLLADIAAKHTAVITNTDSENAAISAKLDSITTVNGQISTEVQAINSHTDTKVATVIAEINQNDSKLQSLSSQLTTTRNEINSWVVAENNQTESRLNVVSNEIKDLVNAKSSVKSIQRGQASAEGAELNITISAVNTAKSMVLINNIGQYTNYDAVSAVLTSSTNLRVYKSMSGVATKIQWQVIEYD